MNKYLLPIKDILEGVRTDYGIHRCVRFRFRQFPSSSHRKIRRHFLEHLSRLLLTLPPQPPSELRHRLLRRLLKAVDATHDDVDSFQNFLQRPPAPTAASNSRASFGCVIHSVRHSSRATQTTASISQRTALTSIVPDSPLQQRTCNTITMQPLLQVSQTDAPTSTSTSNPAPTSTSHSTSNLIPIATTVDTTLPVYPASMVIKVEPTVETTSGAYTASHRPFVFDPDATYLLMDVEGPEESPVELSVVVLRAGHVVAANHDYALPLDRAAHDRSAAFCHCIKLSALESLTTQSSSELLSRAAIFSGSFLPATILSNDENPDSDIARLARRWLPDVPYSNVFTGPWARRMSCGAHRLAYVFKESGGAICGVHCPVAQLHCLRYRHRSRKSGPNDTDIARNAYGRHCSLADALEIWYWLRLNFYSPHLHAPTV